MNAEDALREFFEPVVQQEIAMGQENIARILGFASADEMNAHQAEARRPISRLRRAKRRIQGRIVRAFINRRGSGWE